MTHACHNGIAVVQDGILRWNGAGRSVSTFKHDDAQVVKKAASTVEETDASGALIYTETAITEYDEDGLEVRSSTTDVDADGKKAVISYETTWTKGADGKPTAFQVTADEDGTKRTYTGDVTVGESGMITGISNIAADGKMSTITVQIEYEKISNPLPSAYEKWKNFNLSSLIL